MKRTIKTQPKRIDSMWGYSASDLISTFSPTTAPLKAVMRFQNIWDGYLSNKVNVLNTSNWHLPMFLP